MLILGEDNLGHGVDTLRDITIEMEANNRNGSKVCTHYSKTGHTVETCYKKHGFPPHWQKSASNVSNDETEESRDEEESKTLGITKHQSHKQQPKRTAELFLYKPNYKTLISSNFVIFRKPTILHPFWGSQFLYGQN